MQQNWTLALARILIANLFQLTIKCKMKILIFFSVSLLFQCRCVSEKKNVMFNFRFGNVCFCKMLLLNELKMQIETSFWLASKKSSLTKHMYIKTATIKYTNEYNPCSTVFPMSRYWTDSKSCKTQWFFWRNFRLCAQWIAIFFCPTGTVWDAFSGFWLNNNFSVEF